MAHDQKHYLDTNGRLNNGYPDIKCRCDHRALEHLDSVDLCLRTKCFCWDFAVTP